MALYPTTSWSLNERKGRLLLSNPRGRLWRRRSWPPNLLIVIVFWEFLKENVKIKECEQSCAQRFASRELCTLVTYSMSFWGQEVKPNKAFHWLFVNCCSVYKHLFYYLFTYLFIIITRSVRYGSLCFLYVGCKEW